MWVLLIFTLFHTGHAGGTSTTTVPGFTSKETCEKAGYEFVSKASDMKYHYYNKKNCVMCEKDGLYTLTYHSNTMQYAYSCMEVK